MPGCAGLFHARHTLWPMSDAWAAAANAMRDARRIGVLTGAGISAESGLRTFRGKGTPDLPPDMRALWEDFDPATLATPQAFASSPELVTRWYDWRRVGCLAAEPNHGHLALAKLERIVEGRHNGTVTVLTQNVDRLHHRAGSRDVVELHGTIVVWRCTRCAREVEPAPEPMTAFPPRPTCCAGGALLRPAVVWFGESLPVEAVRRAAEVASNCDVFLSVGTSSLVYPAAGFIEQASMNGAKTIEINPEATPHSGRVDWSIRAKAGEALPRLLVMAYGEPGDRLNRR